MAAAAAAAAPIPDKASDPPPPAVPPGLAEMLAKLPPACFVEPVATLLALPPAVPPMPSPRHPPPSVFSLPDAGAALVHASEVVVVPSPRPPLDLSASERFVLVLPSPPSGSAPPAALGSALSSWLAAAAGATRTHAGDDAGAGDPSAVRRAVQRHAAVLSELCQVVAAGDFFQHLELGFPHPRAVSAARQLAVDAPRMDLSVDGVAFSDGAAAVAALAAALPASGALRATMAATQAGLALPYEMVARAHSAPEAGVFLTDSADCAAMAADVSTRGGGGGGGGVVTVRKQLLLRDTTGGPRVVLAGVDLRVTIPVGDDAADVEVSWSLRTPA